MGRKGMGMPGGNGAGRKIVKPAESPQTFINRPGKVKVNIKVPKVNPQDKMPTKPGGLLGQADKDAKDFASGHKSAFGL